MGTQHCTVLKTKPQPPPPTTAKTSTSTLPPATAHILLSSLPLHALVAHCEAIVTAPELDEPPQTLLSGFPIDRPCEPPRETQLDPSSLHPPSWPPSRGLRSLLRLRTSHETSIINLHRHTRLCCGYLNGGRGEDIPTLL
ncbi:hypothetical protein FALCPG4_003217 [Fusarium falciforme]